jgi:hypothetical protein
MWSFVGDFADFGWFGGGCFVVIGVVRLERSVVGFVVGRNAQIILGGHTPGLKPPFLGETQG